MTDALGNATTYTYDEMDRVLTITDPRGGVTTYTYTDRGDVATETDAEGYTISYEYDGNHNMVKKTTVDGVTTYEYDPLDRLIKTTTPDGKSETIEYNGEGQVVASTDKGGHKTSYVLDANGNVIETIDALGNSALFEYDLMGNLVKTSLHRVDTQDGVDEWEITLYEYDGRGLTTKQVDALGNVTTYAYDGNGNLKTKTDPDGYVTTYGYNGLDMVTSINYNDGKEVTYQYNKVGDLVEMTDWTGTTTFEVDLLNRITKTTDTKGKVVSYTYDATGNQTSVSYPDGTTATKTYDLLGQLKTVTEHDGRTTTYTYDGMGRTVKMEYPHGWVEDYHYDSIGQLLKVEDTDPSGKDMKQQKHVYKYDDCGNMTYEYMRGNGTGEATVENFYTYDALHRVTNAKENYGNASRTYQYDSLGNLTWETNSNNVTTDYKLNNLNQITEKSSDGWKTHTTFTYDKRGNLIQEQYGKNKKVTSIGTYTYDETNKMVKGVNANAESSSYLYNGLGALVEQTWVIAKNSYGYHDVLAEAVDSVAEEPETAGDPVDSPEVPAPSDDNTTETDAALDEAPADSADSGIMLLASSNKDHSGKKPSDKPTGSDVKKTSTVVKEFVVDYTTETHEPLMEHEVNGLTYRYVYGNDRLSVNITGVENGSSKLIENGNQIRLYYHMDYLGTADYLTSPLTGKVESWTHYNEWGEITHNAVLKCGQRELDLVKRYATHDFDAVLNQYYAKARFYDAENRHFTAMDPILDPSQYSIKEYVDEPVQLVQYLYVSNNPIVYIDPLGLMNYFTQTDNLLSGVWQGVKDNTVGLVQSVPQAIPMLKELIKGVVSGDIDIVTLAKAVLTGALGDYWYVVRNVGVLNPFKKNTDSEVYRYGRAVGSVGTDIVLALVGATIVDKAFDVLKGSKVGQKIISLAKQAEGYFDDFVCTNKTNLSNALYDITHIGVESTRGGRLLGGKYLDDLINSGKKVTVSDVIAIGKTKSGRLVWLEQGNAKAGLTHVLNHANEFVQKGIPKDNIPEFLIQAVTRGKVVGYQNTRPIYELVYRGRTQRVAITVGNNGFIVGANMK